MRNLEILNLDVDQFANDQDLPTLWEASVLELRDEARTAGFLRGLGYVAWNASMQFVNGTLEIVDEDLFLKAQDYFAQAREVDMTKIS